MSSTPEAESTEAVCPHLGLAEDSDSHATYATDAHRCYRLEKPTRIAPNHQDRFCLTNEYTTCPIFQGEGIAATLGTPAAGAAAATGAAAAAAAASTAPKGTASLERPGARPGRPSLENPSRGSLSGPRPRPGGISMRTLTIGIFVLAAIVLAFSFWLLTRGDDDDSSSANPDVTETATSEATTPSGGGTGTETPGTGTPGTTPTGTTTPGTGTPTSGEDTYTVQPGDTCSGIADQFGVTLEDFLAANPDINADCTNLGVDQVVNIP